MCPLILAFGMNKNGRGGWAQFFNLLILKNQSWMTTFCLLLEVILTTTPCPAGQSAQPWKDNPGLCHQHLLLSYLGKHEFNLNQHNIPKIPSQKVSWDSYLKSKTDTEFLQGVQPIIYFDFGFRKLRTTLSSNLVINYEVFVPPGTFLCPTNVTNRTVKDN